MLGVVDSWVGHTARAHGKLDYCSGEMRSGLQERAMVVATGVNWNMQESLAFTQQNIVLHCKAVLEKSESIS